MAERRLALPPEYREHQLPPFLYRCPCTGLNVQGWSADEPTERGDYSFEAVTCLACGQVHLVNPKTGKVIGEEENE